MALDIQSERFVKGRYIIKFSNKSISELFQMLKHVSLLILYHLECLDLDCFVIVFRIKALVMVIWNIH